MSERRSSMPRGPMDGGMPGEKAKDFKKSMKMLQVTFAHFYGRKQIN